MLLSDDNWQNVKKRKVRRVASHLAAAVHGETVLLHGQTGQYFGLNPSGSRIWEMSISERTLEEIVGSLLAEFDVELERLERDVIRIVSEMEQAGLVQVSDA